MFYADGFLRLGVSPHALMLARGLDTSQLDLLKYIPHFNPNEPRVPAGYHRESGRWTSADDNSGMGTQGYTHLAAEDSEEQGREDEKDLSEAERRALRGAPRKEDVEEGRGVSLQTPLVEEGGGRIAEEASDSAAAGAGGVAKTIEISPDRFGEAAEHARDAIQAGKPDVLTIDRSGRNANRAAATGGFMKVPGMHLDEYPPAMFKEGGAGASVRAISPHDNMSLGAYIGFSCRRLPNGARIKIKIGE
ncbi:MAG: NucA/NucB deoxyribonuclease domain-containing protein [Methylovirgula sp.]